MKIVRERQERAEKINLKLKMVQSGPNIFSKKFSLSFLSFSNFNDKTAVAKNGKRVAINHKIPTRDKKLVSNKISCLKFILINHFVYDFCIFL